MPFYDPEGSRFGIATFPYGLAPQGLATRRQLRRQQLRPAGQQPVAQLMWRSRRTSSAKGVPRGIQVAYLYEIAKARPYRPPSPKQLAALAAALRARRICPTCGVEQPYCLPRRYGQCQACHGWDLPSPEHTPTPSTESMLPAAVQPSTDRRP
ncbi:RRQRL motif-containing zinc-binding protein [Nonomuraea typhae]|uniref:RRQRL motif-containing zinc-binding protein n=1 Tax=Nonomuraea typhae TaxID=2603600 RepID=UPI001CA5D79B|nr:RRQRL motif-containing zinc-binding protein [Nonomuraea typhae]